MNIPPGVHANGALTEALAEIDRLHGVITRLRARLRDRDGATSLDVLREAVQAEGGNWTVHRAQDVFPAKHLTIERMRQLRGAQRGGIPTPVPRQLRKLSALFRLLVTAVQSGCRAALWVCPRRNDWPRWPICRELERRAASHLQIRCRKKT